MTLYQFNSLDEQEQTEAVWDAVHMGQRWDEEHNILIYQTDNFYIEVFYHRELNVIRKIAGQQIYFKQYSDYSGNNMENKETSNLSYLPLQCLYK